MQLRISILFLVLMQSFVLIAQKQGYDTIPYDTPLKKVTGEFITETRIDTAITLVINELMAQNSDYVFDNYGDDDDWFEIYNYGDDPVLLNKIWCTDNPAVPFHWKIDTTEPVYLHPGEHFLVWADGEPEEGFNHANFKISGDGEFLGLYTSDLQVIDQVSFGIQTPNISYGRSPDAGLNWKFFDLPTPGFENSESGGGSVLPAPVSNYPGGMYDAPISIDLFSPVAGTEIRYTLDANDPVSDSPLFNESIEVKETTILKARIFREGNLEGPVLTCSYFFQTEKFDNPVVSIVAVPDDLYGDHGIIRTNASNLEIPAHFEYIENRQIKYASGTGIQLHAATIRKPTSLRFYARSRYGNNWFGYPFFGNNEPFYFKRLILRNSGNDNVNKNPLNTHFRDLLIHEIAARSCKNPMTSAGRPVNVFLNGKYHGIFNMRERIDEFYIETHTGITQDYDLLERAFGFPSNQNPIVGSFENWNALKYFTDTAGDVTIREDFDYLASQVDLENFTDYWMTEVFVGNYDWMSNNVKFWKSAEGKWQWIFWDLDHGLGLKFNKYGLVDWNTLEWSLTTSDRAWPNGYNNWLIRNMMRNTEYRDRFIRHFATLLNTSFAFTATEPVFDSLRVLYENDMVHHALRYENNIDEWNLACDSLKYYLKTRPAALFRHMEDFFGLQKAVNVRMNVIPEGAGHIIWAGEKVPAPTMDGKYFSGLQYTIDAQAVPDFSLSKWTLNGDTTIADSVTFSGPVELNAYFLPDNGKLPVVLTEIYTNNRDYYDCGDWIEFLYYGHQPLDLSGAELLEGDDHVLYTFRKGTVIYPATHFVVAEDKQSFCEVFTSPVNVFGNLASGFNRKPQVSLRLKNGTVADQVSFMNSPGWPELPEKGFSLERILPVYDGRIGANWQLSKNRYGSPGLTNSRYYAFLRPEGKDSIFTNREPSWIRFSTSDAYYSDPDGHKLAGIRVISKQGPGKILHKGEPVTSSAILEPADLYFEPAPPYSKSTELVYRLIDRSGTSSDEYVLEFLTETKIRERVGSGLKVYPNPARDHIMIETEIEWQYPYEFTLYDITGKPVLHQRLIQDGRSMSVSISGLVPGLYFYILQYDGQRKHGIIEVIR